MPTYATAADCSAYIAGLAIDNPAEFDKLIEHAERDVDSLLTFTPPRTTALKVDPDDLETWQAGALTRAVCAQVEYRLAMGEEFFIRDQHDSERGPAFSVSGKLSRIGPKVLVELGSTGLVQPPGSGSAVVPSWLDAPA